MRTEEFDTPQIEALFELMVIAAAADDEIAKEEKEELFANFEALTAGRESLGSFESLFAKALGNLAVDGREARLTSVRERLVSPTAREAALVAAIRMFAVDGIVRTSEREAIMEIADALGIDTDHAADLVRDAGR